MATRQRVVQQRPTMTQIMSRTRQAAVPGRLQDRNCTLPHARSLQRLSCGGRGQDCVSNLLLQGSSDRPEPGVLGFSQSHASSSRVPEPHSKPRCRGDHAGAPSASALAEAPTLVSRIQPGAKETPLVQCWRTSGVDDTHHQGTCDIV